MTHTPRRFSGRSAPLLPALPVAPALLALLVILLGLTDPVLAMPALAGVIDPGLANELAAAGPTDQFAVIVMVSEPGDPPGATTPHPLGSDTPLLDAVAAHLREAGVTDLTRLWLVNGLAFRAPAQVILEVSGLVGVSRILRDTEFTPPKTPSAPQLDQFSALALPAPGEWNLEAVGATTMWRWGFFGRTTTVACVDTGVASGITALNAAQRMAPNGWYDAYDQHATPYDSGASNGIPGHGTPALVLAVGGEGQVNGETRSLGMAPQARWMGVKIFNDAGVASIGAVLAGLGRVADPNLDGFSDDAPDVAVCPWAWAAVDEVGTCQDVLATVIDYLHSLGTAVVFSAGNTGPLPATDTSPGNNPLAVAVGAVDQAGAIVETSARGPSACDGSIFPELSAPGFNVISLGSDNFWGQFSGTSFAAPHVAGALALLRQALPEASLDELIQALEDTADDGGEAGPDNTYGYGRLRVDQAYLSLATAQTPCLGDLDDDGVRSLKDVRLMRQYVALNCSESICPGDLNGDSATDEHDLNLLVDLMPYRTCP